MREKENMIRCARVGDYDRGGRAKTSLYAWIPDLTLLFFLQLCESAVDNLRSPPDVFIVPVSLRKWIFSQMSYFRSVYCHSKESFRTRTIHPPLVSITSRSIRRNRIRMSAMLSRRLCISAASEVRVRISFSATYPTLKISTLRASENTNSVLKSLHAAAW